MAAHPEIRVGTSGWNYKDWKGRFYPSHLPQKQWLRHYQSHFNTVELNFSFYRLPSPAVFAGWREVSPEGFVWAVKAHRMITHYTRFKERRPLLNFLDSAKELGASLGVILFQLPPYFRFDAERLSRFLGWLPENQRYAIEPRDASWFDAPALKILNEHRIALVMADSGGRHPSQEHITAGFLYLRFHGSGQLYASKYTRAQLRVWAKKLRGWRRPGFVYFNNDVRGYAVENAFEVRAYLEGQSYKKQAGRAKAPEKRRARRAA